MGVCMQGCGKLAWQRDSWATSQRQQRSQSTPWGPLELGWPLGVGPNRGEGTSLCTPVSGWGRGSLGRGHSFSLGDLASSWQQPTSTHLGTGCSQGDRAHTSGLGVSAHGSLEKSFS